MRALAVVLALSALAAAAPARAVVAAGGDGTGHATPPANDPGFAHVAALGDLTGVYLGGGWILTADHVPPDRDAVILGVTYPAVPGSRIVLETAPGVPADLALYRIEGDPGLPWLEIASSPPIVGEPVVMVGQGWTRLASPAYWDAAWQPTTPAMAAHAGFERGVGRALRWGTNEVVVVDDEVVLGGRTTTSFATTFDEGVSADEAQAVQGDSGGAVFAQRAGDGVWELAGAMFTVGLWIGQPADTAVFGTATYAVQLADYREAIEAVTRPAVPAAPAPWRVLAGVSLLALAARAASARTLSARARRRTDRAAT
ncbi:MAG: trypsin-like peptidase domain-containing protein [Myxococcales bacterium]|nr:trypsin-like peptidase domain-containing protein [Myxococcales bacterium]